MSRLVRVTKTVAVSQDQVKAAIADYLTKTGAMVSADKVHFATSPMYTGGPVAFAECSVVEVENPASQLPLFP